MPLIPSFFSQPRPAAWVMLGLLAVGLAWPLAYHIRQAFRAPKYVSWQELSGRIDWDSYDHNPFQDYKEEWVIVYASRDYAVPDLADWYQLYKLSYYLYAFCPNRYRLVNLTDATPDAVAAAVEDYNFMVLQSAHYEQKAAVDFLLHARKPKEGLPPGDGALAVFHHRKLVSCLSIDLKHETYPLLLKYCLRDLCQYQGYYPPDGK